MILVYVPQITERVKYTFDLIFNDILKISYNITSDKEEFTKSSSPKFSYGKNKVNGFFHLDASDILFEEDIKKQNINLGQWLGLPSFFPVKNEAIPFDIFGASFYLVSRYEEYLPHSRDTHNRFRYEGSIAYKGGFLERPIVNLWALELKKILKEKFPVLEFPHLSFSFTPTIDIDNAYAYKHKGWARTVSSITKKMGNFEFKKIYSRIKVLVGFKKDPYDSYDKQRQIHKKYNLKPLYFILLGDYGKFDKNISYKNKAFRDLIISLNEYGTVGLHPSYASNKEIGRLMKEKERLEGILGTAVNRSRQHYIKLSFPDTYRNLIKAGIKEDYSLGYPARPAFRASVCTQFRYFDLERNQTTELKVLPFIAMDTTFKVYMRYKSKEVIPYLAQLVSDVKKVGGNFHFVFHNESIGDDRDWKNWGHIYEDVIKLCLSEES